MTEVLSERRYHEVLEDPKEAAAGKAKLASYLRTELLVPCDETTPWDDLVAATATELLMAAEERLDAMPWQEPRRLALEGKFWTPRQQDQLVGAPDPDNASDNTERARHFYLHVEANNISHYKLRQFGRVVDGEVRPHSFIVMQAAYRFPHIPEHFMPTYVLDRDTFDIERLDMPGGVLPSHGAQLVDMLDVFLHPDAKYAKANDRPTRFVIKEPEVSRERRLAGVVGEVQTALTQLITDGWANEWRTTTPDNTQVLCGYVGGWTPQTIGVRFANNTAFVERIYPAGTQLVTSLTTLNIREGWAQGHRIRDGQVESYDPLEAAQEMRAGLGAMERAIIGFKLRQCTPPQVAQLSDPIIKEYAPTRREDVE